MVLHILIKLSYEICLWQLPFENANKKIADLAFNRKLSEWKWENGWIIELKCVYVWMYECASGLIGHSIIESLNCTICAIQLNMYANLFLQFRKCIPSLVKCLCKPFLIYSVRRHSRSLYFFLCFFFLFHSSIFFFRHDFQAFIFNGNATWNMEWWFLPIKCADGIDRSVIQCKSNGTNIQTEFN